MDALSDPAVETVVVMSSAQVGKTEVILCCIGFFIDQDPSPMLAIQPTLDMAKVFSSDRLAPMLRDTPCIKGLVKDARTRDSQNKILQKTFPGGFIALAGANSPASLASRPIRVVLCDEVDRYPLSAGTEGDPVDLAFKRATTFWNRKKIITSTPTVKGISRVEKAYFDSDMRRFWVPCPHCGEFQTLKWPQVKWPEKKPREAHYVCESCGGVISDSDKMAMVRKGEWRAEGDFNGVAGFHLNELYSPWVSFGEIAYNFLKAKRGGRETLKVWVNTSLGETWEEAGDSVEPDPLFKRREHYGPAVPKRAAVLTAGVDVQDDRLEVQVIAWGRDRETWVMDYRIFYGDTARNEVFEELNKYLEQTWTHESGVILRLGAALIDAFGHRTEQVYRWVSVPKTYKIFSCKGSSQSGDPLLGRPSRKNLGKVWLYPVGTDTAKDMIFGRLRIVEPGPGYIHFPVLQAVDQEYFKQLTAEKAVTRYKMGQPYRTWEIRQGLRNEALDTFVYATAAMELLRVDWDHVFDTIREQSAKPEARPALKKPARRIISRGVE